LENHEDILLLKEAFASTSTGALHIAQLDDNHDSGEFSASHII
jgi:hypothetical protein